MRPPRRVRHTFRRRRPQFTRRLRPDCERHDAIAVSTLLVPGKVLKVFVAASLDRSHLLVRNSEACYAGGLKPHICQFINYSVLNPSQVS